MRLPKVLSPPVLRTAGGIEEERSATWLELFFDLVFVVAIAQLAVALAEDFTVSGFLRFILLFGPVWWSWTGYTMYADRFDTDDAGFRAMMLAGMLAIAALAVSIPDTFSGSSGAFAISYIAVRVVLILLYERARRHVPAAHDLCAVTMAVFGAGTALWCLSLVTPEPLRFGLWGLALAVEGATPWLARRAMSSTPVHASHLPERFGLFTIIVLGESLVAVVVGVGDAEWGLPSALTATAGFAVAASLWWVYFDFIDVLDIKRGLLSRNIFIYGHLLIALGLTATGVGIKKAILYADEGNPPAGVAWALGGGAGLFLVALAMIYAFSTRSSHRSVLFARSAAGVGAFLLAAAGPALPLPILTGALLLIVLFLVLFEIVEKSLREPGLSTVPEEETETVDAAEGSG